MTMLFLNQPNTSGSSNMSCSSFSIRRGSKVQPNNSEDHANSGDSRGTEGKCLSTGKKACEKNNTSSNSDEGCHGDMKNPPLQHNNPMTAIAKQAIPSVTNESESATLRNEKATDLQIPIVESSDFSCEQLLTDSSYDDCDVPDLVDEDIFLDSENTQSLPVVTPQFRSSTIDNQESTYYMPLANDGKPPIVIKSSLRVSKRSSLRRRPATERRVRGLWSSTINKDCHWYKLRDETVVHILGFLNLAERLKVGMLANRYRSLVHSDKALWVDIDATEFVHTAYTNFLISSQSSSAAQAQVGKALEEVLQRYNPISLTIRDIHGRLSANSYLPNVASLQELTLTHFDDLSDTHAHVLLLITHTGAKKKPNTLRRLSLNHCPLLTNGSLRSVASQCAFLESLNLQGCSGITNLESLANLLTTETKQMSYEMNHNHQKASFPTNTLFNMFAPPPPPTPSSKHLADMFSSAKPASGSSNASIFSKSMFAPPSPMDTSSLQSSTSPASSPRSRSKARCSSNPLQSLFAPPGMSPERKVAPASGNGMALSSLSKASMQQPGGGQVFGGNLHEIDLRGTAVQPTALLKLFVTASDNNMLQISLRSLWLDGNQWTDKHLEQLGSMLADKDLTVLSLACCNLLQPVSGYMTDTTLNRWAERMRFSRLRELNLGGHHKITAHGLANLLQQTPKLETLTCRGAINIFTASSPSAVTSMMKRLGLLRKKQSLRVVDLRDCELDTQSRELVHSHLMNGKSRLTVLL